MGRDAEVGIMHKVAQVACLLVWSGTGQLGLELAVYPEMPNSSSPLDRYPLYPETTYTVNGQIMASARQLVDCYMLAKTTVTAKFTVTDDYVAIKSVAFTFEAP